jgi:universal stress protein A
MFEEDAMRRTITRILVPTDFGPASDAALDYSITVARQFGASLQLLHVVDDPVVGGAAWGSEVYIGSVPALRETLVDEATTTLSALRARAERDGIAAESEVRLGRPAAMIREVAEQQGVDLIVMGTHGRTGVAHLLIGSVAERVLRSAPCPVTTVRTADPLVHQREMFERELAPTE